MRLPRGVVKKRDRYFARIWTKGGEEKSYPLGPDLDVATQRFYAIKSGAPAEPMPQPATAAELTVEEATQRWLRDRIDLELELRNAACIRSRVDRSLVPFMGPRALRSIRRADCHAYLAHVRRTNPGLMPATIGHYLRTMREFLNWCVDVELLDATPWPKRRIMPKVEKAPPDRLIDEEVEVLVALPEPWGFNMRLALNTGLRWRELVRLERTDLTPDGQLLVRRAKDKEFRTVPIPKTLLTEIMARRGRLFTTREGKPYSEASAAGFAGTIRRLAAKCVKELPPERRKALAGLAAFHIHRTRHSYACRYVEAGGAIITLQEILGHSSLRMTQRYARPNEKAIRVDAARVFSAWETPNREQNREHSPIPALATDRGKC